MRQELITKLVCVGAGIKDKFGQMLGPDDVMPWLKLEEPEATPEDMKRMFRVKTDG